jgi:hypothetical protein
MTLELGLTLAALALVDSLSIGTLLIPLFFLVTPGRVPAGRVLLYLATIAGFYLVVGLALTAGADTLLRDAAGLLETPGARWVQLVAGAALLAGSFLIDRKPRAAGAAAQADASADAATNASARPGRLARWRDRAMSGGSPAIVVSLALGAGLIELATMLPYLGAVGMITAAGLPVEAWVPVLAAYCAVMVAPALVLLAARVAAGRLVERPLRRLTGWLERNSAENTAWIVGIVGFLLARDAATQLGLFGFAA